MQDLEESQKFYKDLISSGWKVWNVMGIILYVKGNFMLNTSEAKIEIRRTHYEEGSTEITDELLYSGGVISIEEIEEIIN